MVNWKASLPFNSLMVSWKARKPDLKFKPVSSFRTHNQLSDLLHVTSTAKFDSYLGTVTAPECNLFTWWREHADVYPHCVAVACCFLAIPALLAVSEYT